MADHTLGEHSSRLVIEGMTPAAPSPMFVEIFNIDGSSVTTYQIDAKEAITKFPETWSFQPWKKRRS